MTTLYIDTRDNKHVLAKVIVDGKEFIKESESATQRPESILNLVDAVCSDAGITVHEVDEITVEQGPGSYTGLKVGVSVANALSFALGKKVNKSSTPILPKYE